MRDGGRRFIRSCTESFAPAAPVFSTVRKPDRLHDADFADASKPGRLDHTDLSDVRKPGQLVPDVAVFNNPGRSVADG